MNWNWNERPTKATVKYYIGDDDPSTVYSVGKYEVTIPGAEVEVTYRVPYHRQTDPRSAFPNMDVTDGEIRIPVTDMVDEVLSRISPVELAQALWQDEDVKSEFMSCLVTRYNQMNIGDADRRKFVECVKEAIHDKALDRLASTMAKLEFEMDRRAHFFHEISRINETLRNLGVKVDRGRCDEDGNWVTEQVLLQFNELDRPTKDESGSFTRGELEVTGKAWDEARAFWRDEVLKRFPVSTCDGTAQAAATDAEGI